MGAVFRGGRVILGPNLAEFVLREGRVILGPNLA